MIWLGFPVVLFLLHFLAQKFSWFRNIGIVDLFYKSSFYENITDIIILAFVYWIVMSIFLYI